MKKIISRSICVILWSFLGLVLFISALLALYTIAEYRPAAIESVDFVFPSGMDGGSKNLALEFAQGELLTFISWNIGYAGLGAKQDFFMDGGKMVQPENKSLVEDNLAGIARIIKNNPADFWLMQEMDENSQRSFNINQRDFIGNKTGMGSVYAYNFKCFFVPYPIPFIGKVASGLGTFTNFTLKNSERYALPVPFLWPVRTANLKRSLLVSRVSLGTTGSEVAPELVLVNLHLEAYDDGAGKIAQTKMLMDFLIAEYKKGNYVIAGGDFNQSFPSTGGKGYAVHDGYWQPGILETSMLPVGWQFGSDENVPTCRLNNAVYEDALNDKQLKEGWQYYIIDGFIVSPNVFLKSVVTLDEDFIYSDHNPVKIEVQLVATE